ncbi:hypothetical protein GCM10010428_30690 [Actinosynnema pretiosum subsp. pretiosum]
MLLVVGVGSVPCPVQPASRPAESAEAATAVTRRALMSVSLAGAGGRCSTPIPPNAPEGEHHGVVLPPAERAFPGGPD